MGRPVDVVAYCGYRGEQEPRAAVIDGERLEVRRIRRRWRSPDGDRFEVDVAGGRRLVLRHAPAEAGGGAEDPAWFLV